MTACARGNLHKQSKHQAVSKRSMMNQCIPACKTEKAMNQIAVRDNNSSKLHEKGSLSRIEVEIKTPIQVMHVLPAPSPPNGRVRELSSGISLRLLNSTPVSSSAQRINQHAVRNIRKQAQLKTTEMKAQHEQLLSSKSSAEREAQIMHRNSPSAP